MRFGNYSTVRKIFYKEGMISYAVARRKINISVWREVVHRAEPLTRR